MRKATMRSLAGLSVAAMLPLAPAGAMTIFVSNEKGNSITVIDGDTMEVTATVDVGNRPRGIALSEDNSLLYICVGDDDHIEVLDTESLEVVDTLPSGPDPELLVISPDGPRLYAANEGHNMSTVAGLKGGEAIAGIPVGAQPAGKG